MYEHFEIRTHAACSSTRQWALCTRSVLPQEQKFTFRPDFLLRPFVPTPVSCWKWGRWSVLLKIRIEILRWSHAEMLQLCARKYWTKASVFETLESVNTKWTYTKLNLSTPIDANIMYSLRSVPHAEGCTIGWSRLTLRSMIHKWWLRENLKTNEQRLTFDLQKKLLTRKSTERKHNVLQSRRLSISQHSFEHLGLRTTRHTSARGSRGLSDSVHPDDSIHKESSMFRDFRHIFSS